jgi:5S rRNA maturation endonuclease (ribonuclease M5)
MSASHPNHTPTAIVLSALTANGCNPRRSGDSWAAICPAHDDRVASLSIGEGRDGRALVKCHAGDGCPIDKICAELGLETRDLFPADTKHNKTGRKIIATYDYVDEAGMLLSQAVRYAPRKFSQRRPDGNGGWIWKLDRTRRVLYRLPDVIDAVANGQPIYIVEGEKDADAGARAGICATTNLMGAGKWRREYSETLRDAPRIVIVADNDETGRKHAEQVARHLRRHGNRGDIEITQAKTGKDLFDHLAAGHTIDELRVIARHDSALEREEPESPAPRATDDDTSDENATQPAGNSDTEDNGGSDGVDGAEMPDLDLDPDQAASVEKLMEQLKDLDPENQKSFMKELSKILGKSKESTQLVKLALDAGVELWRDPEATGYATIPADDHVEHWPVRSRPFRLWLRRRFYEEKENAPTANAVRDAVETLEGRALFAGDEYDVHVRVAEHNGNVYLDLCDDGWRCVEITATGWTVRNGAPVRFKRRKGMYPLPEPKHDGDVADLRPFSNVTDEEWPLVLGWLVGAFRPRGPYPVLDVTGEHGDAKTTLCRVLRRAIDPNRSDVRAAPRETHDLMIAAGNGWVCAFDNLSWLRPGLSDDLARLATGAGFATRKLYEDDEEQLFDACRPVIINGIEDVVVRPDLLDRSIIIHPPKIEDDARRDEDEFWAAFKDALPGILGALLDAVSRAVSRIDALELDRPPRMADFARWVVAAEPALGIDEGAFLTAYRANRQQGQALALEANEVTAAIYEHVKKQRGGRDRPASSRTPQARTPTEGLAHLTASDGGGTQAIRSRAARPRRHSRSRRQGPPPALDARSAPSTGRNRPNRRTVGSPL